MVTLKRLSDISFLLLLVLFPCVSFLAEFTRDMDEIDLSVPIVSGGEMSGPGETALLVTESLLLYSQPLSQSRVHLYRLWRQFLALIVCALLLNAFSKVTLRTYYLHHYFPREFFHNLLISFLLGGRAPPRSAY